MLSTRRWANRQNLYIKIIWIFKPAVIAPASLLFDARKHLNLTQAQAAGLLATSQANSSAYERGRLVPGRIVAERSALSGQPPHWRGLTAIQTRI